MHTDEIKLRQLFKGLDQLLPVLGGEPKTYINFDNAASTPPFKRVQEAVDRFLTYYSSVHRGTGFKSQLSTHAYEQARSAVLRFVGANPAVHTCIFGKNTTEAINKLARRFPYDGKRDVVLVSLMEHHSNDLPWRGVAKVVHVGITSDGRLDEADLDQKLRDYASQVALVAITGASNVTGYINPIHRIAEKAHAVGAQFLADCAQLAPHRTVSMLSLDDPAHLDYVSISAHKMYAPYGTGALIGRTDTFARGDPDMRGGGEVEIVTEDEVVWSDPPERDEAGSPNTVGAVALAAAISQLEEIGMRKVVEHEAALTRSLLERLLKIPGVKIYGDRDPARAEERLGVVPFNINGVSHFLAAAVLGFELGIGVRNGCFCAHPYILNLLGVAREDASGVRELIMGGDRREVPGMVRVSFGLCNHLQEIDRLIDGVKRISRGDYSGVYKQNKASGEYFPEGWRINFEDYFKL